MIEFKAVYDYITMDEFRKKTEDYEDDEDIDHI
jgi:hypothetical protein